MLKARVLLTDYFKGQIKPQSADSVLTVSATDASGNQSEPASIVVLDRTAPNALNVNTFTKKDQKITGRTEANATVTIQIKNEEFEVKADQNGNFSLYIPHRAYGEFTGNCHLCYGKRCCRVQ